jgi:hypothetical protein
MEVIFQGNGLCLARVSTYAAAMAREGLIWPASRHCSGSTANPTLRENDGFA